MSRILPRTFATLALSFIITAVLCDSPVAASAKLPFYLNWKDKPASAARHLESAGLSPVGENRYSGNFMNREVTAEVSFKGGNGALESVRIHFDTNEVFDELSETLTSELGKPTQERFPELRQLQAIQKTLDSPLWYFPKEGLLVYLSNYSVSPFSWAELAYVNTKANKASIWPIIMWAIIITTFATASTVLIRHLKS